MTAVDDRLKLGEDRRLIFQNVANNVPTENIMAAFLRSEAEIWREVDFVSRKIREYRFRRHLPPLETQGIRAIQLNRKALLDTVDKLGPEYLASDLILPQVHIETLDHPSKLLDVKHRMGGK